MTTRNFMVKFYRAGAINTTYQISSLQDPWVLRRSLLKIFRKFKMAARSCDQVQYKRLGARVLMVPDWPAKFEGSTCNGFLKVGSQKTGGRRRKKKDEEDEEKEEKFEQYQ